MKLPFLHQEVEVSTDLRESNDILDNPDALKERIATDGYLLIRGLHDKAAILAARRQILERLGSERYARTRDPFDGWHLQPRLPRTDIHGFNGQ